MDNPVQAMDTAHFERILLARKDEIERRLKKIDTDLSTLKSADSAERATEAENDEVLEEFDIALGKQPIGPKQFEGDGKTPEGAYYISHKNPKSQYHLSLGVSYPNPRQVEFARSQGKSPGGDIFIHGGPPRPVDRWDWTAGCIAVSNTEMREIWAATDAETLVEVRP